MECETKKDKNNNFKQNIRFGRLIFWILLIYFTLSVAFFFLTGDQLKYRISRGNISIETADSCPVELREGIIVEQNFSAPIQRLQSVTVQLGTFYRENSGTITIELYNPKDETVLMNGSFSANEIAEGQYVTIRSNEPIEGLYNIPLMLRLFSNSPIGAGVAPMVSSAVSQSDEHLYMNGNIIGGRLCFSVSGTDYIWIGIHYWKFIVGLGILIVLSLATIWKRHAAGKHSYVVNGIVAIKKYRFLIDQLVARDFKTKYKRSVLGMFWSFLNPLLTMIVQYIVFSTLFKSDIPNYPTYLLVGIISFNFFSEACGMCLTSIVGNASLITKVYMPKYIYPLTRLMSSAINLVISLIPLLIVSMATGVQFKKAAVLALFFWVCLIIFSLGLGMLLSAAMVFFRDMQFLWGVLSMIWMYATPIFYPESIIPERFKFIWDLNPLCQILRNARICILEGISPEPISFIQCFVVALVMFCIGAIVFSKTQNKFVLYL
ncbi:ABC transporter permease [Butyricicoccus faecihominis]|uniref:ABC transporter permease n=1 Tax=Butyricicoccus faecihominis TaxID=1712515 RepID=UPI00247A6F99|nr:ABC transporter permease [Butyricicoccus faecihominis]MCQ5128150.1 ABC transporter permease [Butyricicoccus faecihominis]